MRCPARASWVTNESRNRNEATVMDGALFGGRSSTTRRFIFFFCRSCASSSQQRWNKQEKINKTRWTPTNKKKHVGNTKKNKEDDAFANETQWPSWTFFLLRFSRSFRSFQVGLTAWKLDEVPIRKTR